MLFGGRRNRITANFLHLVDHAVKGDAQRGHHLHLRRIGADGRKPPNRAAFFVAPRRQEQDLGHA